MRLKHVRKRVTRTHCLRPFFSDEIGPYVVHRLAMAGSHGLIGFSEGAIERIYRLSGGYARVVNALSDRCLLILDGQAERTVTGAVVDWVVRNGDVAASPRDRKSARDWFRVL